MKNTGISKHDKTLSAIYFTGSFLFFAQAIINVEIVPMRGIVLYLGLPDTGMGLILLGILIIAANVFIFILLNIYSSCFPSTRQRVLEIVNSQFLNAMLGFFTIVVTLMSFATMAAMKILPMQITYLQVISLYIFWFLMFKAIGRIVKVSVRSDN